MHCGSAAVAGRSSAVPVWCTAARSRSRRPPGWAVGLTSRTPHAGTTQPNHLDAAPRCAHTAPKAEHHQAGRSTRCATLWPPFCKCSRPTWTGQKIRHPLPSRSRGTPTRPCTQSSANVSVCARCMARCLWCQPAGGWSARAGAAGQVWSWRMNVPRLKARSQATACSRAAPSPRSRPTLCSLHWSNHCHGHRARRQRSLPQPPPPMRVYMA